MLLWLSDASLVHVPTPHGAVLDIRPRTLNFKPLSPQVSTNVLSDPLRHLSLCDFSGDCISATFMTGNISRIHCDCWTGHHTGTHINLYSAYAHRPLLFRCFRCCRCCAAAATASQPVSSTIHFHATPVESRYCLVGSCGVAAILPTTRRQSDLNWKYHTVCPNLLVASVRVSDLRIFF